MTTTAPEPPVSENHLRDRLLAVVQEIDVDTESPRDIVEKICDEFVGWLRLMAADFNDQAAFQIDVTGYAKAAALLVQGLADGIENGRPA